MKTNSHPVVICKKTYDVVYTEDEEKRHEVKTTQYFLPHINLESVIKALKVFLFILLIIAILTDKIKEVTPIINFMLEQLR